MCTGTVQPGVRGKGWEAPGEGGRGRSCISHVCMTWPACVKTVSAAGSAWGILQQGTNRCVWVIRNTPFCTYIRWPHRLLPPLLTHSHLCLHPNLHAPTCDAPTCHTWHPPPPRVVHLRLQEPEAALGPLRKLHGLLPDQPEVLHCLALAHDMMGDSAGAIRWLEMLTSLVPHDPGVLCKLGAIYHRWGRGGRGARRGTCIRRAGKCGDGGEFTMKCTADPPCNPLEIQLHHHAQSGIPSFASDLSTARCTACRHLPLLHPHPLRLEEEARSLSYYQEAHRAWPVNLDVISWLGAFHVRNEVSEAAPAWAQGDVVVG